MRRVRNYTFYKIKKSCVRHGWEHASLARRHQEASACAAAARDGWRQHGRMLTHQSHGGVRDAWHWTCSDRRCRAIRANTTVRQPPSTHAGLMPFEAKTSYMALIYSGKRLPLSPRSSTASACGPMKGDESSVRCTNDSRRSTVAWILCAQALVRGGFFPWWQHCAPAPAFPPESPKGTLLYIPSALQIFPKSGPR